MTFATIFLMAMTSILTPVKTWYSPSQPIMVSVKPEAEARLVLTTFEGRKIESAEPADLAAAEADLDLSRLYPEVKKPGAYLVYLVPKDKKDDEFIGTPLVLTVREDKRPGAPEGTMVTKVEPLKYALMETSAGPMTMAFYYDVAPNTVANFLSLAEGGYYDGLKFHRVVPGFVIQGGDPRGDGTGGPGYQIDAEFNNRPHRPGVLSMARSRDENSAGSQFFICLDYAKTQQLDKKYTAFGKVTEGEKVYHQIAATPLADENIGKPVEAPVIQSVKVLPVEAGKNPYAGLFNQ